MAAENTATMVTKKTAKKKRKISKHMLQAKTDRESLERARAMDSLPGSTPTPDPKPVGKVASAGKARKSVPAGLANSHTKDVKEAAGYLTNWKSYRGQWKFNKNTQSWLIRHMYESDNVPKASFEILMEYLLGLQGQGAKDRILQEATRRALRYKKYSDASGGNNNNNETKKTNDADEEKKVQFSQDIKEGVADSDKEKKRTKKSTDDAADEEARWTALSDHDKRKEYKRARKVLETLREPTKKD